MSLALRTKEAATKSKSFSAPNLQVLRSFSVREGSRMCTSGMLMDLLLVRGPPLFHRAQDVVAPDLRTLSSMRPSPPAPGGPA